MNEALEIVEESALSKAEIYEYDMFWDRVRREATAEGNMRRATAALAAATAERDAATARADAAVEKLHQAVRQMKADGLTAETIAKYTGMTAAEVDSLP